MTILDCNNPEQDKIQQAQDSSSLKWRRSGMDRRAQEGGSDFLEERRQPKGRRSRVLEVISALIFPRGSRPR